MFSELVTLSYLAFNASLYHASYKGSIMRATKSRHSLDEQAVTGNPELSAPLLSEKRVAKTDQSCSLGLAWHVPQAQHPLPEI